MEIKEYVGALAGKGRIVAAVAIIAGFFAVVVFIFQPQKYKANATVAIPQPPSTTTSAIATSSQAYADFNGALSSHEVAEKAADAVGVPVSDVSGHLSSSRLEGSSFAEVTYTGTNRDLAPQIAEEASQAALEVVIASRVGPLQQQQTLAQNQVNDASDQYEQFVNDTGLTSKDDQVFRQQQLRIVNLGNQIGAAKADGDDALAAERQTSLDDLQAKVAQESADLARILALQETAQETLAGAEAAYITEQGILNSVTDGSQVSVSDATSAPRLPGLMKAVVPAVVVATGLAIALIVLLEVVGPVRLPARRRGEAVGSEDAHESESESESEGETGGAGPPEASAPVEDDEPAEDGADDDEGKGKEEEDEEEEDEEEEPERDPAGRIVRSRA